MTEHGSADEGGRHAAMESMMSQFFGGMDMDEKKRLFKTMMGKMTEGFDMSEMMPEMMKGMMSGSAEAGPGDMPDMMSKMMQGCHEQQMPDMMLRTMMPHCIGMMLPAIDPDKRGEIAATLVSEILEKGSAGMSDAQRRSFHKALSDVLTAGTESKSDTDGDPTP